MTAVEITDEMVEAAAKAACELVYPPKTSQAWEDVDDSERDSWRSTVRAALEAALPYLTPEPECGAADRTGQRRCVFTPGHHEVENWTSHADRGGWTWNDQPAEVKS